MPSGCVGRRISHTSKDPARLFYYLSATQHSVAIGEIFARTALWKHSIQLFHLNYYSFFLKCLYDPSEWQYERSAVLHVLHFHETFDVILFSEFSFSSLHKLSSQQQINMARRQVSKPTGKCPQSNVFSQTVIFSPLSGGFLCTNSWHFPKNDICKIRPCECERFKWTRPEESDRKRRPHKKTDGLGYAISLTTGQQKSSHALDKGA